MDVGILIVGLLIGLVAGAVVGMRVGAQRTLVQLKATRHDLELERARVIEEAEIKAKEVALAAKADALKVRDEAEAEQKQRRIEWQREEERLAKRREELDQKLERVDQRERREREPGDRPPPLRRHLAGLPEAADDAGAGPRPASPAARRDSPACRPHPGTAPPRTR